MGCDLEFQWGREMQEERCDAVVDFANEHFGYGIIPSATQEEMLMCAMPEALVGCILSVSMDTHEAILVTGARHVVHCTKPTGIAPFRYLGRCSKEAETSSMIIGVDASK